MHDAYLVCVEVMFPRLKYSEYSMSYGERVFPVVVGYTTVVLSHGQRELHQRQYVVSRKQGVESYLFYIVRGQ